MDPPLAKTGPPPMPMPMLLPVPLRLRRTSKLGNLQLYQPDKKKKEKKKKVKVGGWFANMLQALGSLLLPHHDPSDDFRHGTGFPR